MRNLRSRIEALERKAAVSFHCGRQLNVVRAMTDDELCDVDVQCGVAMEILSPTGGLCCKRLLGVSIDEF